MAGLNISQDYNCEFIDPVANEYYCLKCKLVARRLAITSCCGESFCLACITETLYQELACPNPKCKEEGFSTLEQAKHQQKINNLQVYCSLKGRGCGWSGLLEQLDTHLDPEQDDCQYVDTKCPLNCQQTIPKNKVEQHMAEECAKRDFVCKHCNFKATYEEVTYKHLPECKYVPLQCKKRCGVSYDREDEEDHIKICRLEEVCCDFKDVGCDSKFPREKLNEHSREHSLKHLRLAASFALKNKEDFAKEIQKQREKHEAEEQELKKTHEEQEVKLQAQEKKIEAQKKECQTLKRALQDQKEVQEKNEQKFEDEIQEQRNNCRAEEQKLKRRLEEQQESLQAQEKKIEVKLQAQEKEIEAQKKEYQTLKCALQDQKEVQEKNEQKFEDVIQEQRNNCRAEEQKLKRRLEEQQESLQAHKKDRSQASGTRKRDKSAKEGISNS